MATDLAAGGFRGGRGRLPRIAPSDRPLAPDRRGARLVRLADSGAEHRALRQVWAGGMRPFFETLTTPEVRRAFGLTLGITALATVVNTIFGIAIALVLVRQRFWGRALWDGVVDLPFAVSPVVAGLMLITLYGPEGWFGTWLERGGFRVIYAVPGMIVATLFVTLPFVVRELVPILANWERSTSKRRTRSVPGVGRRFGV